MLTLRARIFAIIGVALLLILGISLVLYLVGKKNKAPAPVAGTALNGTATTVNTGIVPTPTAGLQVKKLSTEEMEKNAAKQLAKVFTERYFSYSSDNQWQNVYDVRDLVTDKLWKQISAGIGGAPSASYVGKITKAVGATLQDWTAQSASVFIQVVETAEKNGASVQAHRNLTVTMVKAGGVWLADGFVWEK